MGPLFRIRHIQMAAAIKRFMGLARNGQLTEKPAVSWCPHCHPLVASLSLSDTFTSGPFDPASAGTPDTQVQTERPRKSRKTE